ncbi:MAG: PEP-utilizing enzyme [bacterium]
MNLIQAKEKIENISWYKQGASAKYFYVFYPWYACLSMKILEKNIPVKYELIGYFNSNNYFMDAYISKRSLAKVAKYYFKRQCDEPQFIKNLFSHWHKNYVNPFLTISEKFLKMDFPAFSDKILLNLFNDYTKIYTQLWQESIFLDSFDFYGEIILQEAMEKEGKNIEMEDLQILLTPPNPSFMQKERLEILKLAERVLKRNTLNPPQSLGGDCGEGTNNPPQSLSETAAGNLRRLRRILRISSGFTHPRRSLSAEDCDASEWLNKKLSQISKNFYWINNDYASVEYLGQEYFFNKLRVLVEDTKKLTEEKNMRGELKNLSRKKSAIAKKYKLSAQFLKDLNFLAFLGTFRDERKTYNQMAGNTLKKFAIEFSSRAKIPLNLTENLFFWEIKSIFNLRDNLILTAKKRMRGAFFIANKSTKFDVFYDKEGEALNNCIKDIISTRGELKGKPAFAGKVKGKVKIIRTKNDFSKMKKGDILVSTNTRPEFLPVMKIAGAIITEEGGITCHAAIVSRELKIPAIVGVQGALDILHDGDIIEVDAFSGMIEMS